MSDLRSPLAKERDTWMQSAEGIKCRDLRQPITSPYLDNRLEFAFIAGYNAALKILGGKP